MEADGEDEEGKMSGQVRRGEGARSGQKRSGQVRNGKRQGGGGKSKALILTVPYLFLCWKKVELRNSTF